MIYEVHLRNPYRVLRIESDSMYSAGDSLTFANNDTAVHLFRLEDVISVTNPFGVVQAEIVTGMREGTRLPLTVDSNLVQDSLQRQQYAPSIRTQNQSVTSGAWQQSDYDDVRPIPTTSFMDYVRAGVPAAVAEQAARTAAEAAPTWEEVYRSPSRYVPEVDRVIGQSVDRTIRSPSELLPTVPQIAGLESAHMAAVQRVIETMPSPIRMYDDASTTMRTF